MPSIVLPNESLWVLGAAAIAVLSFLFGIIAIASTSRHKKNFRKWKSIHDTADLEQVYERTVEEVGRVQDQLRELQGQLQALQERVNRKISTARIERYNAFSETGSDLSFSIALIDDEQNGVVLSSIYGREESRTYAKPVAQGNSRYTLTEEEQDVIQMASGKQPVVSGRTR